MIPIPARSVVSLITTESVLIPANTGSENAIYENVASIYNYDPEKEDNDELIDDSTATVIVPAPKPEEPPVEPVYQYTIRYWRNAVGEINGGTEIGTPIVIGNLPHGYVVRESSLDLNLRRPANYNSGRIEAGDRARLPITIEDNNTVIDIYYTYSAPPPPPYNPPPEEPLTTPETTTEEPTTPAPDTTTEPETTTPEPTAETTAPAPAATEFTFIPETAIPLANNLFAQENEEVPNEYIIIDEEGVPQGIITLPEEAVIEEKPIEEIMEEMIPFAPAVPETETTTEEIYKENPSTGSAAIPLMLIFIMTAAAGTVWFMKKGRLSK
jgi:hypothetical protein